MFKQVKEYSDMNSEGFSFNPVTLSFYDGDVEKKFNHSYFQKNLQLGRVCQLIAIFFYGIFAFWEVIVIDPSRLNIWLWVCSIVTLMFLSGFALSYFGQNYYKKYWKQIFAFYVLITGFGFTVVTVVSSLKYPTYNFVGIIFCLFFCYSFIRSTFVWATAAGNTIVLVYILSSWIFVEPPIKHILTNFFHLFGINLLGMMMSYSLEIMSRRDFLLNELLKSAENKTKDMNLSLEQIVRDRTKEIVKNNQELKIAFQRENELVLKLENEEVILQKSLESLQQAEYIAKLGYFERNWKTGKGYWSKGFYSLLDYSKRVEAPSHEEFLQFIHQKDRAAFTEQFQESIRKCKTADMEFRIIKKNGDIIQIHGLANHYYDDDGLPLTTRAILQDITDRKNAANAFRELENKLAQSQKMESIGTLAGGIAHDFNNILFPIMGNTEMLIDDIPENSPFQENLTEINKGVLRARDLVKQILTFSRQEKIDFKFIKVQNIVEEALKLIRATIPTTIDIKQNLQANCGSVKADSSQIHQIIMNLATNSYHAMKDTGGELNVGLKEVELEEADLMNPDMKPGVYALLTLSDQGTGIDNDLIKKIFDPFFTTKEKGKGTGLGLSVVHGIVNSMNGDIQVYSEPGIGTEFKVYFPVETSSLIEHNNQEQTVIQGGTENILLVDDEASILLMEKRLLIRLGYQVTSCGNSIEALELFDSNPAQFDLVISDMAMPGLPGNKLAAELLKIRPEIPILLCTGFSDGISVEKARSLGIKGFLMKPIGMKHLARKIREVLVP